MNVVEKIKQEIQKIPENKGKPAFVISAVLIAFAVLALIAGIVQCASRPAKHKPLPVKENNNFSAVDEFTAPEYKPLSGDYYFSRVTSGNWTDEDIDRWFTVPDEDGIQLLSDQNTKIINDVLGETP